MTDFDQGAGFAAQAEPEAVLRRLFAPTRLSLPFRGWFNTRAIPLPGGRQRTADLVAILDATDIPEEPWLCVLEFQSQHDPDKLDVTFIETAIFRGHARHGEERRGRYRVLTGLIFLQGRCPKSVLDMTVPGDFGPRHAPLVWNVADDDAEAAIEAVANGAAPWGLLFWVALMTGAGREGIIARWKEVVVAKVADRGMRSNLAGIALVFAELAGCYLAWERGLEGWEMTESQVVRGWISQGETKGRLAQARADLLRLVHGRFPGAVSAEVVRVINEQGSLSLLDDWFGAAVQAATYEEFLATLKQ